jgi:hypothetical protein
MPNSLAKRPVAIVVALLVRPGEGADVGGPYAQPDLSSGEGASIGARRLTTLAI